jgi:2-C-methyl-D-erythritol 4-phosphate cytidylyltransferase / 2-C-methyl-D-erythritol 2,4-cyclodiphosphate synthase
VTVSSRSGAPSVVADAIVVAAGRSSRMGGVDKVLADLGGRPLLAWSLEAIAASPEVERIVVVLDTERASQPRPTWYPEKVVASVAGGNARQASVAAGVRALAARDRAGAGTIDGRVLLVHDGARPLVSTALVSAVARAAAEHGAALPVVPIAETIKRVEGVHIGSTIDRSGLALAQTPQGVRREVLERAYAAYPPDGAPTFTDEAALLEACAVPVRSLPGDPRNVKVTEPADLALVRDLVAAASSAGAAAQRRVGIGFDGHPFGPGTGLRLGGIEITGAPRLHGHSDGDVALHATADALLGAAALGDLGALFPADRRTPRGVASAELLAVVIAKLESNGWRPASVDLTIVGARPRLSDHLPAMRVAIAALLGLDASAVSVKASSGNLSGDEGAGRSIAARAIAAVAPLTAVGSAPRLEGQS